MNFKPKSEQEYQPVSSSGLENPMMDDEIEYVPISEEEDAPDTARNPDTAPYTLWSEDLVSGIRSKIDEVTEPESDQMKPVSSDGGIPIAYEMSVPGTVKTEGDRNLPPYTASSLDPDQEAGNGREAA